MYNMQYLLLEPNLIPSLMLTFYSIVYRSLVTSQTDVVFMEFDNVGGTLLSFLPDISNDNACKTGSIFIAQ